MYLDVDFFSLFARFLDTAGMKRSKAYLVNGIGMFVAWLVIKIVALLSFFLYLRAKMNLFLSVMFLLYSLIFFKISFVEYTL